jgi:hypothetical protein
MSARVQPKNTNHCGMQNLPLTPEFSPVVMRLLEQKPFKRLSTSGCADTRVKPDVSKK